MTARGTQRFTRTGPLARGRQEKRATKLRCLLVSTAQRL
jgi:hypothetical protein